MNNEDMLARLLAQASGDGAELVTLRAIVEESSELGTRRVLARMGPEDATAELRQLLGAWRDAKASARRAAVEWIVRGLLAMLLLGIALRFGATGLFQ